MLSIRKVLCDRLERRRLKRAELYPESGLGSSAIVFAPHFDDETLGCGGTIIRKRAAGAEIHIVFMTDGSRSHPQIPGEELVRLRATEAMAVAEALEVPLENVHMLGYEDGRLSRQIEPATQRVAGLISEIEPEQIFLPYKGDKHADHVATNTIVRAAAGRTSSREFYEYPVWFWHHWPWIPIPLRMGRSTLHSIKTIYSRRMGRLLVSDFNCHLSINGVIEQKRSALERYESQMSRKGRGENHLILSDVAGGEFLRRFFGEYEIFRRYRLESKMFEDIAK